MNLDLSALEESTTPVPAAVSQWEPPEILLSLIDEDENQPRKKFDPEALAELTDSVRERGVLQPITVAPHPVHHGRWLLKMGGRRFKAALGAGLKTIPAIIKTDITDFDQVIENEHRDNLKPMELAAFIRVKLEEGTSKAAIAKKLGKDASWITHHISLLEMPAPIAEAWSAGRCTSPKTVYELSMLYKKHPTEVDAWLSEASEVTRTTVAVLADIVKSGRSIPGPTDETPKTDVPDSGSEIGAKDTGPTVGDRTPDSPLHRTDDKSIVPKTNPAVRQIHQLCGGVMALSSLLEEEQYSQLHASIASLAKAAKELEKVRALIESAFIPEKLT